MSSTGAAEALEALRLAVDGALEVDFDRVGADEFASLLDAVQVQRRRLDALDVQMLAAADEQFVAAHHCRSSSADLLVHRQRVSPGEAGPG